MPVCSPLSQRQQDWTLLRDRGERSTTIEFREVEGMAIFLCLLKSNSFDD